MCMMGVKVLNVARLTVYQRNLSLDIVTSLAMAIAGQKWIFVMESQSMMKPSLDHVTGPSQCASFCSCKCIHDLSNKQWWLRKSVGRWAGQIVFVTMMVGSRSKHLSLTL